MGNWIDFFEKLRYNSIRLAKNRIFHGLIAGVLAIGVLAPAFFATAVTLLVGIPVVGAISYAVTRPLLKRSAFSSSSSSADNFRKQDEKEGKKSNNPVFNALIDKLRNSHIRVVTDWKKAKRIIDELPEQYNIFKGKDATVYGFVHEGVIYLNPSYGRVDIPIHEYTHLWAEVLRQRNPDEWKSIVSMLKKEKELWKEVKKNYPHLKDDDEIADEVLATFSGRHGAARLNDTQYRDLKPDGLFNALTAALERFWKNVAEFFNMHYETKEDIADRVLSDMLHGVNPLDSVMEGKKADARIRTAMEQNNNNNNKTVMENNLSKKEHDRLINSLHQSTKDILLPYLSNPSNEKKRGLIGKILQDPVNGNYWAGSMRDNNNVLKLLWDSLDLDFQKENQQLRESIKERIKEWTLLNYQENRKILQKIREAVVPHFDNPETPHIVFLQEPVDVNLNRQSVGIYIEPLQDVDEDAVFIKYQDSSGTGIQRVPYWFEYFEDGAYEHFDHLTTNELSDVYSRIKEMSIRNTIIPVAYKENYSRDSFGHKNQPNAYFSKELDDELVKTLEDNHIIESAYLAGFVKASNLRTQADYNAFHGALYETSRFLTNRNAIIQTDEQKFEIYFNEMSKENINTYLDQSVNLSETGVYAMEKMVKFYGGEIGEVLNQNRMSHVIFSDKNKAKRFLNDYLNREGLSISTVKDMLSSEKREVKPEKIVLLDAYITERGGNDIDDRLNLVDAFLSEVMFRVQHTQTGKVVNFDYTSDVLTNIAKNEPYPDIQYHGERAREILNEILASGKDNNDGTTYIAHSGATGMYEENGKYVAFDNCTNDCWVEEFQREEGAVKWLTGEFSAEEIHREEEKVSINKETTLFDGEKQDSVGHLSPIEKDWYLSCLSENGRKTIESFMSDKTSDWERNQLLRRIQMDPINGSFWAGSWEKNIAAMKLLYDSFQDKTILGVYSVKSFADIDGYGRSFERKDSMTRNKNEMEGVADRRNVSIDMIKSLLKSYKGDEYTEVIFCCEVPVHENKSGEFDNELNKVENSAPISIGLSYRPSYNAISVLYEHSLAGHSSDFNTVLGLDERDLKQEEITSIYETLSADIEKYGKLSPVNITEADGIDEEEDDDEEVDVEYIVSHSDVISDKRAAEIAEQDECYNGFTEDNHPKFTEWEDAVRYAVKISKECHKVLDEKAGQANTGERYLSDEQINDQYKGYKVNGIKFYKQVQPDAWSGVVDLEFPNAEHPDFDESMCNPFISYDKKGEHIAFDNWLPDDVYKPLCETVRSEHIKYVAVRAFVDRVNDMSSHAHYTDEQRTAIQEYLKPFGEDKSVRLDAINDLRTAAMAEDDMQHVELKWVDDAQIEANELLDGKVRNESYGRGI